MKTLRFKIEKQTKGAVRYCEVDDNGEQIPYPLFDIGTLYIRKTAAQLIGPRAAPQEIEVTIKARGE